MFFLLLLLRLLLNNHSKIKKKIARALAVAGGWHATDLAVRSPGPASTALSQMLGVVARDRFATGEQVSAVRDHSIAVSTRIVATSG